ncbi:MAG: tetratricopeptide repeat protein [Verrucomicrobia bacterium]|nr:tetratricopeptide repeat protein [Verrucomicrobiota bacterium]
MSSDPISSPTGRWTLGIALCVAILTLACFWPAVSADFVAWDDDINLYENARIQKLSGENLSWMFMDLEKAMRYKPLSWLTWAVIHEGAGLKPAPFHFANVLLHTVNAVVLFFLLRALLGAGSPGPGKLQNELGAAVGSLFWSLHPLRVEPVAWATGLPYCLSLCFALGMMLCYWRFAAAPAGTGSRGLYCAAVVLFVLALLTYPIVISLAITPVAMDWWLGRQRAEQSPWLRWRHAPFFAAAALLAGIALFARFERSAQFDAVTGLDEFTIGHRIAQAFYVWAYYCWRMAWPVGLSPLYSFLSSFSPGDWPFLLSGAVIIGASAVCFFNRRRWPAAWIILGCHLAWLVPVLGLTENLYVPCDRYSYASGMLGGLVLAVGTRRLMRDGRTVATVIAAALLLGALTFASSRQVRVWHDTPRLFAHMIGHVESEKGRSVLWLGLGSWHQKQRAYAAAERAYTMSLAGTVDAPNVHHALAQVMQRQGRHRDALPHYEFALQQGKADADMLGDFAVALLLTGQTTAAEQHISEAVRRAPGEPRHRHNWALILKRLGRDAEASAQESEARRIAASSGAPAPAPAPGPGQAK